MKIINMWLLIILIFIVMPVAADCRNHAMELKVNQILSRRLDITGDGVDDHIMLYLKGTSWQAPLKWELKILSKGKTIFIHRSDDTPIDKFFHDPEFVNKKCNSYLACKKQYYLHDLLNHLCVLTDLSPNRHAYDMANQGSIYFVARDELLNKFKLPPRELSPTIDAMIKKLRTGKAWVLYVPISPLESEYPRMYVKQVNSLVTIYKW